MNWFKRGLIGLLILGLIAVVGFNVFKKQIATVLFERAVERNAGVDRSAELGDGLHVFLCGTGAPMPDATRAGPCVGIIAGDRIYVFDVGSGGVRNLGSMGFPINRLNSVYLTHLHSDHLDGLGELLLLAWVGGSRSEPLPVVGPVGTAEVVDGFNTAYRIDSTYRVAHHGPEIANPSGYGAVAEEFEFPSGPTRKFVVFEDGDLRITAIPVNHAPVEPAVGYRIDYKDRSISLSGDTVYFPAFVAASEGVDLMLHEALNAYMVRTIGDQFERVGQRNVSKIMGDILDYHTSPEDAAKAAQEAGAKRLVLYHLVPPIPVPLMETVFLGDAKSHFDGPITVGKDGMIFSLPANSDEISISRMF